MRAGLLLIVGFEGKVAPPDLLEKIAAGEVGGVILFARNLGTLEEIATLTRTLQQATPKDAPPLIVSVDQEGGRVQRIRAPLTVWPAMVRLGERNDVALTESVGQAMGRELAALGFNLNYAPVLDVHTNPQNPVIGDRAFGSDEKAAATQALAYFRGLESAGVRGCGKHFPGHGDTETDSHLDLPVVRADAAHLRRIELTPFAEAVRAGVQMIMTAHVVYPAIDSQPATHSSIWLTDILRKELGFSGVVVSDDLDMKALSDRFSVEETVRKSLAAGVDAFLACRNPDTQAQAEQALDAAEKNPALNEKLNRATERLLAFRHTLRRNLDGDISQLPRNDFAALAKHIVVT